MNAKNLIVLLSVAAMAFAGCNSGNYTQTSASLKKDADSASFYLGYFHGRNFKQAGFEINREALIAGINAAMQGKDAPGELADMDQFINKYVQQRGMIMAEENQKKGEEFLAANAKKDGVVTTESGLQYKIEKEGTGAIPVTTDKVKVHYRGTLIDGTEFDASLKHGTEPAQFQPNQVIPGWTEALTMMPVGSKWTLYIPSNLAYGPRQAGDMIAPNSTLIFEVELLEIVQPEKSEE